MPPRFATHPAFNLSRQRFHRYLDIAARCNASLSFDWLLPYKNWSVSSAKETNWASVLVRLDHLAHFTGLTFRPAKPARDRWAESYQVPHGRAGEFGVIALMGLTQKNASACGQ
jgi:hypothetical protein